MLLALRDMSSANFFQSSMKLLRVLTSSALGRQSSATQQTASRRGVLTEHKKIPERVWVVFLPSASTIVLIPPEVYFRHNTGVEAGQGECSGLDQSGTERGVETRNGLVKGETGMLKGEHHSFLEVSTQLMLSKKTEARG